MTAACARCGAAFARDAYRDLHLGRAHDALAPPERAAFEAARAEEEAWLAHVRRHVRGGLAALPVALSMVVILLLAHLGGVPFFLGLLLLPGAGAFAAVLYYMQWSKEEG